VSVSVWYFVKPRDGSPLERVQATLYHQIRNGRGRVPAKFVHSDGLMYAAEAIVELEARRPVAISEPRPSKTRVLPSGKIDLKRQSQHVTDERRLDALDRWELREEDRQAVIDEFNRGSHRSVASRDVPF
jgi:hypothetical protein